MTEQRLEPLTSELSSRNTAFIERDIVEGHVPPSDVLRLLPKRSDALRLTVPGVTFGSPCMEMCNQRDAYDTRLVLCDGSTEVFERRA